MLTRSFIRCLAVNSARMPRRRRAWPLSARLGSSISGSSRVLSAALSLAVAAACTNEGREFGDQSETSDASTDDAGLSTGEPVVTDATTSGNGTTGSETLVVTADDETTAAATDATTGDSTDHDDSTRGDSTDHDDSTRDATSDPGASDSSGSATLDSTTSTTDEWATSETSNASVTTTEPSSSADETSADDQFGVGEPPDFGNLGSGEGRILVVNTLEDASSVDVWLAGSAEPLITRLAPRAASRELVTRGPQRVVFTRTGTHDVVGCSDWFPLRGAEQWAVVTSGGDHTCAGSGDGGTSSFRQEQPLDENPIRYVHATTPDRFSITREDQAEPGVLEPGATLTGTSLPSCTSGCEVNYRIAAEGVADARYVTLEVTTVEELPPAGEVLLLVLGNVRQDWPSEPDALRFLRVDLDGATYELQRDPEIAFGRIGEGVATFSISTPPSTMEVASVDPYCAYDTCPLQTLRWRADTRTFFVEASGAYAELEVEIHAGHRYVLLSTNDAARPLYWLDADFDRSQPSTSRAAAVNLDDSGDALSFGYVFGNEAVAIDTLSAVPWGEVSAPGGGEVPAENGWDLVTATGSDDLGVGCFYSVDTPPGFRGYLVAASEMQPLDVTLWPPTLGYEFLICF